jgi:hypothetical protein
MKATLLALISLFSIVSYSQQDSTEELSREFSLIYSYPVKFSEFVIDNAKYGLMYRKTLNSKWKLKLSGSYRSSQDENRNGGWMISPSDSIMIARTPYFTNNIFELTGGFDYYLSESFFIGSELVVGYNKRQYYYRDEGFQYFDDRWVGCTACAYEFNNETFPPRVVNVQIRPNDMYYSSYQGSGDYLTLGLKLNLGGEISISDHWLFAIQYTPQFTRNEHLNKVNSTYGSSFHSYFEYKHFNEGAVRFRI